MSELKTYNPDEIDDSEWRSLQELSRTAFRADLADRRNEAEIDALVGWDEPAHYLASHLDPNTERGQRYNQDQDFRDPRIVIAKENNELVGFGYIASNVSGATQEVRDHKYRMLFKRYAWIREIVVSPEYRRQKIAAKIGNELLTDTTIHPFQPVATYVWPNETPHVPHALQRLGFSETGTTEDHPFGDDMTPTMLTRMQARTAYGVTRRLRHHM